MELKNLEKKIPAFIKKYRSACWVLLIGVALLLISPTKTQTQDVVTTHVEQVSQEENLSEELASILSTVEGAGNVKVFLSVSAGEEIVYQTDTDISTSENQHTEQITTVTVSSTQQGESGIIKQKIAPIYKGAIVVCEGADDPSIQLAIVNAVSKATGLGADRISVLKMK